MEKIKTGTLYKEFSLYNSTSSLQLHLNSLASTLKTDGACSSEASCQSTLHSIKMQNTVTVLIYTYSQNHKPRQQQSVLRVRKELDVVCLKISIVLQFSLTFTHFTKTSHKHWLVSFIICRYLTTYTAHSLNTSKLRLVRLCLCPSPFHQLKKVLPTITILQVP